ncbi:hypothetical protein [Defluviitalea raffinosedens]|uniref:Uncharacterized protein n=1 Tax=Defluviitalea raffinosedens TaxID=1450156 RepID=A0A7C8HDL2_9FIRM|nr:hypothetical protein [Defluviitalea raffinosedens]KAE9631354.1 hypothetical protein GND95_11370 [Defluviitalea raffinosedens]MBM7684878.1 hypothetical protein [Defluviitalea raffinosedens]HHW67110.1 hypothetical protein [Candidatus Epulonipiscium sp.]
MRIKNANNVAGAGRNRCNGNGNGNNSAVLPANIKDVLRFLNEDDVKIVLKSGKCEEVEVLGVNGNLLAAEYEDDIKFVDIDCICEVIADPEDVIEGLFKQHRCNC